jgi:hypothetical protein
VVRFHPKERLLGGNRAHSYQAGAKTKQAQLTGRNLYSDVGRLTRRVPTSRVRVLRQDHVMTDVFNGESKSVQVVARQQILMTDDQRRHPAQQATSSIAAKGTGRSRSRSSSLATARRCRSCSRRQAVEVDRYHRCASRQDSVIAEAPQRARCCLMRAPGMLPAARSGSFRRRFGRRDSEPIGQDELGRSRSWSGLWDEPWRTTAAWEGWRQWICDSSVLN